MFVVVVVVLQALFSVDLNFKYSSNLNTHDRLSCLVLFCCLLHFLARVLLVKVYI